MAKKVKSEIRREQIAEAALALVAREGVAGLSVAGVARRVGLVPSAIYRHFSGRDEVIDAVIDLLGERLQANVAAVRAATPRCLDRLDLLLDRHVRLVLENRAIPRIIFSDEIAGGRADRRERLLGVISGYLDEVAGIVLEGQRRGEASRRADARTAALLFIGAIQPPAMLWHLSGGEFDLAAHARRTGRALRALLEEDPRQRKGKKT